MALTGLVAVLAVITVVIAPRLAVDRTIQGQVFASQRVACTGVATPTVVLSNGLGADNSDNWDQVVAEVSRTARVCVVDRPGSEGTPARPAGDDSPADDADLLRTSLAEAKVPGPYIYAGWSYGGSVATLAALDDKSRAGLVLIESIVADEYRTVDTEGWQEDDVPLEMAPAETTIDSLRPGVLGTVPLVSLTAGITFLDDDDQQVVDVGQAQLANLSTNHLQCESIGNTHALPVEAPAQVSTALIAAIDSFRRDTPVARAAAEFTREGARCLTR
jgi:pimeloyl-ACP methyl ester carboxylesterase